MWRLRHQIFISADRSQTTGTNSLTEDSPQVKYLENRRRSIKIQALVKLFLSLSEHCLSFHIHEINFHRKRQFNRSWRKMQTKDNWINFFSMRCFKSATSIDRKLLINIFHRSMKRATAAINFIYKDRERREREVKKKKKIFTSCKEHTNKRKFRLVHILEGES